jgi:hypothetical protein
MINKIISELKNSPSEIVKELISMNLIPIRTMSEKTPTYGLWDTNKKYLQGSGQSKEGFKYLVGGTLRKVINSVDLDALATFSIEIDRITKNPFEYRDFYKESDYYKGLNLNNIRYSKYKREVNSIKGDSDIDLILKSIRINDEININNFSLTEIIIAHQTFHTTKIMAIPCLFSEDRGVGKTTLALAGGYLYDKSEDSYFKNINMGDGQKAQWGDYEIGTRTVVFDDIPNDNKIVEPLIARIKSSATSAGDITANKKGGGMIRTNSYNQALTTNSIYGIPLDDIRDRRVHPINIHASDFTDEELISIKMLNIPMSGARDKHYPIIQKILNHLFYVYEETKDNGLINEYLNKELPNTKFKTEVAKRKASAHRRFEVILLNTRSLDSLINELADEYAEDKNFFNFLNNLEYAEIAKVRNKHYLHLKADGLVSIGRLFSDDNLSAKKVAFEYFKSKEFKQFKVNGNNTRCIRFEMKNFKNVVEVEIEEPNGTITITKELF